VTQCIYQILEKNDKLLCAGNCIEESPIYVKALCCRERLYSVGSSRKSNAILKLFISEYEKKKMDKQKKRSRSCLVSVTQEVHP